MITNEVSTQKKFLEKWVVKAGNKEFILNEDEVQLLKEIDKQGQRGIVWFGDFAISIPHIEYIALVSRTTVEEAEKFDINNFEEVEKDGRLFYIRKS